MARSSVSQKTDKKVIAARNTCALTVQQCSRLLRGQSFYLHLPESMHTEKLANRLELMGGVVERFFHKDIKYVVVNERAAGRRRNLATPAAVATRQPYFESRGRQLLQQVVGRPLDNNDVLVSAHKWDIPVKRISSVNAWLRDIEKQMKKDERCGSRTTIRTLRATFLKVEDLHRPCRPLVKEFNVWPSLNFSDRARNVAPFDQRVHSLRPKYLRKDASNRKDRVQHPAAVRKSGYCEPCGATYKDLGDHLRGKQHQKYANNTDNFTSLDHVVSLGPNIRELQRKSRAKKKLALARKVRFD